MIRYNSKLKLLARPLCWIIGHNNKYDIVENHRSVGELCSVCLKDLPVAYPHHEIYSKIMGQDKCKNRY
jgi:hypothetical protein